MAIRHLRAILGVDQYKVLQVLDRAQSMEYGFALDPVTYSDPRPSLPVFRQLIQDVVVARARVGTRVIGAREERDAASRILYTAMESERAYVQELADADWVRAGALILNAGLLVAGSTAHGKRFLVLRNGTPSGTVECDAFVGLLIDPNHPRENRHFDWEHTLDGGGTFLSLPSTSKGKTTIHGLPPLTRVGVRVRMVNGSGPGPWSQVATILVI